MSKKTSQIKSLALRMFELSRNLILIAMVLYLISLFVITIFIVSGPSMEPNFQDKNLLLINQATYWINEPQRGDVVVFKFPGENKTKYIKRIIGLPGETIELKDDGFYINGIKFTEAYLSPETITKPIIKNKTIWKMGNDEYFVCGDNRANSNDSRVWGALPKDMIIGKATFRLLPTYEFGTIK